MVKANRDCFKNSEPTIRIAWDLFCSNHKIRADGSIYITKKDAKFWKLI